MVPPAAISGGRNLTMGFMAQTPLAERIEAASSTWYALEQSPNSTTSDGTTGESARATSTTSSMAKAE
jgi:hypothetical protein